MPVSKGWQLLFLVLSGANGADAFSAWGRYKTEEVCSTRTPRSVGCRFNGLGEVASAAKEEIKKGFEFRSVLTGKALSAEADDVEAGNAIDALSTAVVGNVFAERAITLNDTRVTDTKELMKHGTASDEGTVADMDMARQQSGIGDDVVGAEDDVMTQVTADHKEVVGSEAGSAVGFAAAMDGDMLPNDGAGSDLNTALGGGIEAEVLGRCADDGSATDDAVGSEGHLADDLGMGFDAAAFRDDGGSIDDDERADFSGGMNLSFGVNDGSGMEHEAV